MLKNKKPGGLGQIRIIAGKWRGRKLPVLEAAGLRPTGDRIRETLFNWLQQEVAGAHCLDLFAGSGALGFEALSRGAASVMMVDNNRQVTQQLQAVAQQLQASDLKIVQGDYQTLKTGQRFDIIFIDPPFADNLAQSALEFLQAKQLLQDKALIYVETDNNTALTLPQNYQVIHDKTSGDVRYLLLQY